MLDAIAKVSSWSCHQLEASLLPTEGGIVKKIAVYTFQFFQFCISLPLAITTSSLSFGLHRFCGKPSDDLPLISFAKHPKWNEKLMEAAPVDIGFATADFQDNGPLEHPNTNWSTFYQKNAQKLGDLGHVPDMWNHPERVIQRLNELGCRKFRFSVSRDKIEPRPGAPYDFNAVEHYRNFCRALRASGIEPMVTLHHFTDPNYFSWERAEDVDGFVRYGEAIANALYEEGVRKIITINEPTVVAFQGWVMGDFPPNKKLDCQGVARVLENMMRAHTRIYEALKARHSDFEVGISHDPIRFRHFHKTHPLWSPIEKILCHYLTEMNHGAFMRFLQTGQFSLKVPFRANYTFNMPKKPPLDFLGLQYYTDPLIKVSLKGGGSVTRVAGEKLTSYDYRAYPQGLASMLEECKSLNVPVDLTEIGIDTGISTDATEQERIRYFDRIFQVVQKGLENGVPIRSLHFWTLIDNLEWHKAWAVRQGFYSLDTTTGQISPRPVSHWIRERIAGRNRMLR